VDNAINEARLSYQRALTDHVPRSSAAKAELPDFGLANFETTTVQRGESGPRLFAFNKALNAQVAFVDSDQGTQIFITDLRTKRSLALPSLIQILERISRPEV
jgi:hypothetical protein